MPNKSTTPSQDDDNAHHGTRLARTEAFLTRAMSTFGDAVYRLALSQTRSKADAEDVYQDVFLRLYNDSTAFASDEHLKAWLLRVTVNHCHDLAKSSWKRRTVAFDPVRDDAAIPAHNDEDAAVWDAVGQLPEQQRAAVNLHYVEGYSTDEIARILQCQPTTARTWLFRARAHVKELLTGDAKKVLAAEPEPTRTTDPLPSVENEPPNTKSSPQPAALASTTLPKGGLV